MDKLQDFNSFAAARKQQVQLELEQAQDAKRSSSAETFKSLLAEYGVTDLNELDEEQRISFFDKLKGTEVNEDIDYIINKLKDVYSVNEAEVTSDEEFKEYAFSVLQKAFGDNFDEAKAQETVDGILSKVDGDYGAAIGMLTTGLGESVDVNEAEVNSEEEFREYAETVLKNAFGDEYDEAKAGEVIDGIIGKVDGDFGEAVGMLQSSLG